RGTCLKAGAGKPLTDSQMATKAMSCVWWRFGLRWRVVVECAVGELDSAMRAVVRGCLLAEDAMCGMRGCSSGKEGRQARGTKRTVGQKIRYLRACNRGGVISRSMPALHGLALVRDIISGAEGHTCIICVDISMHATPHQDVGGRMDASQRARHHDHVPA
ncbi:10574_t:CDS:2, partial [Scutellospora calospora]